MIFFVHRRKKLLSLIKETARSYVAAVTIRQSPADSRDQPVARAQFSAQSRPNFAHRYRRCRSPEPGDRFEHQQCLDRSRADLRARSRHFDRWTATDLAGAEPPGRPGDRGETDRKS